MWAGGYRDQGDWELLVRGHRNAATFRRPKSASHRHRESCREAVLQPELPLREISDAVPILISLSTCASKQHIICLNTCYENTIQRNTANSLMQDFVGATAR